jgi:hypothetical protein
MTYTWLSLLREAQGYASNIQFLIEHGDTNVANEVRRTVGCIEGAVSLLEASRVSKTVFTGVDYATDRHSSWPYAPSTAQTYTRPGVPDMARPDVADDSDWRNSPDPMAHLSPCFAVCDDD